MQGSPNFQALFQDLPDLTPPRKKLAYSSFPGQSPSGVEFGFPRLTEGTPDRQRLGLDFFQRPSSGTITSPPNFVSPRGVLGVPPLPIFQPSPMRGSQASTYQSPDSKDKRRLSDISEFQRFSMSPGYQGLAGNGPKGITFGEGKNCLTSAFADILDGHSRVSPKHFSMSADSKSGKKESIGSFWKDEMVPLDLNNASNSPIQLPQEKSLTHGLVQAEVTNNLRRKSLDFSDANLSPMRTVQDARSSYPASPGLLPRVMETLNSMLPIHPLEHRSKEISPDTSTQKESNFHSHLSLNTSTQSPMGVKIGLFRREDIIDSPAVKEATDAAVAAAMKLNSDANNVQVDSTLNLKRPQRAAAAGVAAAAAAASGAVKGRRSNAHHTSSLTSQKSEDAIFMQTSIPGMNTATHTKCKCKKSRCLKLYCECFKARGYCGPECSCECCSNKPECDDEIENARDVILTRNPQAFAGKIAETIVPSQDGLMTSGVQHTKGCNCKKSKCQKKYCECFQAGVPCGEHCKCNGCANTAHHHDAQCAKNSGMVGLTKHYLVAPSMHQRLLHTLGRDPSHTKSMALMRKIVHQNAKTDASDTLIPVNWEDMAGMELASDSTLAHEPPEVIEGLTPIAPSNLEIKTEKDKTR